MTIRLRLALQFGAILGVTLLFALAVYIASQEARRELFTQSLFQRTQVVVYASPNRAPVVSRERCNFHYLTTEK